MEDLERLKLISWYYLIDVVSGNTFTLNVDLRDDFPGDFRFMRRDAFYGSGVPFPALWKSGRRDRFPMFGKALFHLHRLR